MPLPEVRGEELERNGLVSPSPQRNMAQIAAERIEREFRPGCGSDWRAVVPHGSNGSATANRWISCLRRFGPTAHPSVRSPTVPNNLGVAFFDAI
jgi:hypothetical protein